MDCCQNKTRMSMGPHRAFGGRRRRQLRVYGDKHVDQYGLRRGERVSERGGRGGYGIRIKREHCCLRGNKLQRKIVKP